MRFGLFTGFDTNNDTDRARDVYGMMIKTTIEYNATLPTPESFWVIQRIAPHMGIGLEVGIDAHYFHGNITPFWHRTYPVMVNLYPAARRPWPFIRNLKIGGGINLIEPFQPHAFAEIPVYNGNDWEVSWSWHAGIDVSLSSIWPDRF